MSSACRTWHPRQNNRIPGVERHHSQIPRSSAQRGQKVEKLDKAQKQFRETFSDQGWNERLERMWRNVRFAGKRSGGPPRQSPLPPAGFSREDDDPAAHLFDQSAWLEVVRRGQRANQLPLTLPLSFTSGEHGGLIFHARTRLHLVDLLDLKQKKNRDELVRFSKRTLQRKEVVGWKGRRQRSPGRAGMDKGLWT